MNAYLTPKISSFSLQAQSLVITYDLRLKPEYIRSQSISLRIYQSFPKLKRANPAGFTLFLLMAERTGLEPATTGVTGRYSNQLNYRSV